MVSRRYEGDGSFGNPTYSLQELSLQRSKVTIRNHKPYRLQKDVQLCH